MQPLSLSSPWKKGILTLTLPLIDDNPKQRYVEWSPRDRKFLEVKFIEVVFFKLRMLQSF